MTSNDWLYGESFRSKTNATITDVYFYLNRYGSPSGNIQAALYTSTGTLGSGDNEYGTLLATSDPIDMMSLSTTPGWVQFFFSGANLVEIAQDTDYHIAVYRSGPTPIAGNYPRIYLSAARPEMTGTTSLRTTHSVIYSDNDTLVSIWADTAPQANFISNKASGTTPLTINFTDTSLYSPTSWLWNFGDGATSTSQNPSHTYSSPGLYDVTLTSTNSDGSGVMAASDYIDAIRTLSPSSISASSSVGTPTLTTTPPPPPPDTDWSALGKEDEKVYVYKVYTADDTYIGIWDDVADELEFSQRLNTPGTTTTVRLARSANSTKEVRDSFTTQSGDFLITEAGDSLISVSTTPNAVGEDTDVDLDYNVDIYVHYGEFANLTTEIEELLTTEAGDQLVVTSGAPLGTRIFSGYIMDYESVYGGDAGVTVTLASHGMELSNQIIMSGSNTTATYTTTALETITKSILDTNPGKISYDTASIGTTGVSETLVFRLNTKLEGIETIYDQTPEGWYWYVSPRDNLLYLRQVSSSADHTFYLGQHIKELRVKRSIENLINEVYFVGGESGGTPIFKHYEDTTSQTAWRKGLERITDRRYTLTASMQRRAEKLMGRYSEPIFTSPLTITSAKYDIESIRLGQTVRFRNFGNFIDNLAPLQIVSVNYTPTAVTVELGELQMRQVDEVAKAEQQLAGEQYEKLPNAPS